MGFYLLWLKRLLFSGGSVFQFSSSFSLLSLILASASLTVAVQAINAFSSGLEKTLIDKQGHLRVQSETPLLKDQILKDLDFVKSRTSRQALFLSFEGLILKEGSFKGVLFEAVEDEKLKSFAFLRHRMLKGDLSKPGLIVGQELAKELKLRPDGQEALVIASNRGKSEGLDRRQASFKISAVMDFGRHEPNSRLILMPLSLAEEGLGLEGVSGINLWLKDKGEVLDLQKKLRQVLAIPVFSWRDMDRAFLEIIESDKKIIFLVLFILIISAGFNVFSALFVQVFRKRREMGILKAMGARPSLIRNIFLLQGLALSLVGSFLGLLLGLLVCYLLVFAQNTRHFIPEEVYRVSEMAWDWKNPDLFWLFGAILLLVILSSALPAHRASRMSVKSNLSYD